MNSNKGIGYEHTGYEHMGYEKEYHKLKHSHLYSDPDYYNVRAELARLRYFEPQDWNKKILEWGVGLGQNIALFKNAIGYDISEFATDFCTTKGVLATTDLEALPENYYEIIISAHVLEHLENPLGALRISHSKLRKNGKLILILPLEVHKRLDSNKLRMDANQHLYSWNYQTLTNLLIKAGFKPISAETKYTYAYKKLLPLRGLSLKAYNWGVAVAGWLMNDKELKIVAVKR